MIFWKKEVKVSTGIVESALAEAYRSGGNYQTFENSENAIVAAYGFLYACMRYAEYISEKVGRPLVPYYTADISTRKGEKEYLCLFVRCEPIPGVGSGTDVYLRVCAPASDKEWEKFLAKWGDRGVLQRLIERLPDSKYREIARKIAQAIDPILREAAAERSKYVR